MPISTNAPFNEFGQTMILRDIEQLYLALSGIGSGSPGDGQTQDQSVAASQESGTSGGIPDLTGLASIDYVNRAIDEALASVPSLTFPVTVVNGGTGATDAASARSNLGIGVLGTFNGFNTTSLTATGTSSFVVPAGVYSLRILMVGGAGGTGPRPANSSTGLYVVNAAGVPTLEVLNKYPAQAGGSGAIIFGDIPCVPGTSLTCTVGAAGSHGSIGSTATAGTNGGDTSIVYGGASASLVAGGGVAGTDWVGGTANGAGGVCSRTGVYYNNANILTLNGVSAEESSPKNQISFSPGDAMCGGGISPFGTLYGSSRPFSNTGGYIAIGYRT